VLSTAQGTLTGEANLDFVRHQHVSHEALVVGFPTEAEEQAHAALLAAEPTGALSRGGRAGLVLRPRAYSRS